MILPIMRIPFIRNSVIIHLVLLGASLSAAQLRLNLPFGTDLGSDYSPYGLNFYAILLGGTILGGLAISLIPKANLFRGIMVALFFVLMVTALILPDISLLQLIYFSTVALLIGLITLQWTPARLPVSLHLAILWKNRELLILWVRYNVLSRYSQTILGILWIVMLPLATAVVMGFVFSNLLMRSIIDDAPFVPFFFAGLTFWSLFTQGVLTGTASIQAKLTLINQIYFPREILVIVKLGEALVDLSFTFVVVILVNAAYGIFPNINYIYLPILLIIQVALMLGLMFFFSYLSVFVRDIAQLIGVVMQIMFYLTPIIYPVTILPELAAKLIDLLNPMAALIKAYRAILIYNQSPDFLSLSATAVISGIVLYSGYMFLKTYEGHLTDFR